MLAKMSCQNLAYTIYINILYSVCHICLYYIVILYTQNMPASDKATAIISPPAKTNIHYIPAGAAFAECLVRGLLRRFSSDAGLAASSYILLPNRRLTEAVRVQFLRETEATTSILPRLLPIGDTGLEFDGEFDEGVDDWASDDGMMGGVMGDDSLPPVIDPLERQLLLARLILRLEDDISLVDAIGLARPLAHLLDTMQTSGVDAAALQTALPEEMAQHWQRIHHFLSIVTDHWPRVLAEYNRADPAVWRNHAIRKQAHAWQRTPPKGLVVVAGSLGTIPATRELMGVVAGLPEGKGAIVLPGVDMGMAEEDWRGLTAGDGEEGGDNRCATHPQYQLAELLAELGVKREDLTPWDTAPDFAAMNTTGRLRLLSEVMRPAPATAAWYDLRAKPIDRQATHGMRLVAAATMRDEAEAVALAMRETLHDEEATAIAITASPALADMIADALARDGVEVPNASGTRLGATMAGRLMLLIAQAWGDNFEVITLLGLLQHPYVRAGLDKQQFSSLARRLEQEVIRRDNAPYYSGGLGLLLKNATAAEKDNDNDKGKSKGEDKVLADFVATRINKPFAPLTNHKGKRIALPDLAAALARTATLLTAGIDGGGRVWQGREGQALAKLCDQLVEYKGDIMVERREAASVMRHLLDGVVLYPDRDALHPRLAILGLVEARMQTASRIILAGMNEEVTPPQPTADPWMNQATRKQLGLPHWEWRVGMVAHDVMMALAHADVLITHSREEGGTPTQPSRWLGRLNAVLDASGLPSLASTPYTKITNARLAVKGNTTPAPRPAPLATSDERQTHMRKFSATQLEELVRDPYAIYARRVLGLKPLPDLSRFPFLAVKGQMFHAAIAEFIRGHPKGDLPDGAVQELGDALEKQLRDAPPSVWMKLFWRLRFQEIAKALVVREAEMRPDLAISFAETSGSAEFIVGGVGVTLTARADRIDVMADGVVHIIDYKTGSAPSQTEVSRGYRPQLIATAMIAARGGFDEIDGGRGDSPSLAYWRLAGKIGKPIDTIALTNEIKSDLSDDDSKKVLAALAEVLADGYRFTSQVIDSPLLHQYSAYTHLARVQEWGEYRGEFATDGEDEDIGGGDG